MITGILKLERMRYGNSLGRIFAIVVPLTRNVATAVVPYLNGARVLAIGPTVITTHLSGLDARGDVKFSKDFIWIVRNRKFVGAK